MTKPKLGDIFKDLERHFIGFGLYTPGDFLTLTGLTCISTMKLKKPTGLYYFNIIENLNVKHKTE